MSVVASATSPGSVVSPRATRVLSRRVAPTARRPTVRVNAGEANDDDQELDFVTRMVMNVFGKDALDDPEPMGLKRMTKEEWPDQWPALVDGTVAELLPTDDTPELKMARAVCKQTQLEFQPLGLAYDANVHGWRASSFHTQLDGQGAAILVATAADGTVFGGYNPKGWLGYGRWLDAISAFLFVYPRGPLGVGGGGKAGEARQVRRQRHGHHRRGQQGAPSGVPTGCRSTWRTGPRGRGWAPITTRCRRREIHVRRREPGRRRRARGAAEGAEGVRRARGQREGEELRAEHVPVRKGGSRSFERTIRSRGEPLGDGGGFKMPKMPWD